MPAPIEEDRVTDSMVHAYKHAFGEYMNKSARGHITPPTPDVGFNATKYALGVALSPVAQAVPEKVLVPVDATEAMIQEALKVDWSNEDEVGAVHNVWHVMLKAALTTQVSHPASNESQPPAGAKIRSTQGNAMEAAPVTGQSPVGAVSPCVSAPEKGAPLDETWKYRIPESLADLIPLFENRVAVHRLWAEWLDQDTEETRRIASSGIGCARAHWDYVKQYSAAKSLIEEHERGAVTDAMIEAVARGICKLHCFDPDRPTSRSKLRLKWMDYADQARAALGAGSPGACRFCADTGWVDDQNWTWDYPDLPQERVPGNGKIRCGGCG
ncbi:MAG: hypothetical protein EOS11_28685 [Mesorhizobium sp.]|nr:MAG: hypothetical protein EOS11_28685 [Mesorhizobium sp.]